MANLQTHALPRATPLRRVPPAPIRLAPSWRGRLAGAVEWWLERWSRALGTPVVDEVGGDTLGELSPHLLSDIGAPEALREAALAERRWRLQRQLEIEQGYRPYRDFRW